MKIVLWIVQLLLALAFLMAGPHKVVGAYGDLVAQMEWVKLYPPIVVKLIGLLESLAVLGLLLPSLLRIAPFLTPLAALGLVLTMVGAAITHLITGEMGMVAVNFVLGAMAAFVAWGRHKKYPISPR